MLGLTAGITIPFMVHDNVYFAIATCFLSPHLKYARETSKRNVTKAIPVEHLDYYFKDIGKSFLLFLIIIGPTLYRTYYLKENILEMEDQNTMDISDKPDSFADLVTKMRRAEQAKAG